jgi:hypothetical protein
MRRNFLPNPIPPMCLIDKRSVGSITSQLQDDAARLQAFSGEPIRSMLTAMSAVIIGVTLSFIVRMRLSQSRFRDIVCLFHFRDE